MKQLLNFCDTFTNKISILITMQLALVIELIKSIANTYLWSDWQYIGFVCTIIVVDTVTGVMASKFGRKENFSSKKLEGFFIKIILYVCYLISVHVALHFTIEGEKSLLFDYFKTIFYIMPIIREIRSIIENFEALGFTIFPTWLKDKIQDLTDKKPNP